MADLTSINLARDEILSIIPAPVDSKRCDSVAARRVVEGRLNSVLGSLSSRSCEGMLAYQNGESNLPSIMHWTEIVPSCRSSGKALNGISSALDRAGMYCIRSRVYRAARMKCMLCRQHPTCECSIIELLWPSRAYAVSAYWPRGLSGKRSGTSSPAIATWRTDHPRCRPPPQGQVSDIWPSLVVPLFYLLLHSSSLFRLPFCSSCQHCRYSYVFTVGLV